MPFDRLQIEETKSSQRFQKLAIEGFVPIAETPVASGSAINNILGGLRAGFEENFTGSLGTIIEAKMPMGRLFAEDQNGQFRVWQSTPDYLGIEEDKWEEMDFDSRRQALVDEVDKRLKASNVNMEGTDYMLSKLVGYFLDPTIAIPILGQTTKARAAAGAAIGATDVSTWEYAQEGKVSPSTVALGASVGAVLPPAVEALKALGKPLTRASKNKHAQDIINTVEQELAKERIAAPDDVPFDYIQATKNVKERLGFTDDDVTWAINRTGRQFRTTNRAGSEKILSEHAAATRKDKGSFGKGVDKLIEPIYNRMKKINPYIANEARRQEMRFMQESAAAMHEVNGFVRDINKLEKQDMLLHTRFAKALANRDVKTIQEVIKQSGIKTLDKNYKAVRNTLERIYNDFDAAGRKIKHLDDHFPRWISDMDGFRAMLGREAGEELDEIFKWKAKDIAKKEGAARALTEKERSDILHEYMQGTYDIIRDKAGVTVKPRSANERKIKQLTDEQMQFYAKPAQALHSYIRQSYEDMMRKRLFGSSSDVLDDSITEMITRELDAGRMTTKDVAELKDLLKLRYFNGNQVPAKLVQNFKNYGYAALLGNPISAITQLGDLALASYRNGVRNTVVGVAKTLTGKGLTPKEMGLMDEMFEEFASTLPSKRFLEASFKYGGFKATDALGKGAIINGAIRKNYKLAKSKKGLEKLARRWQVSFGDEFPQLIKDLKAGKLTENVKLLAFSELSDLQPVSKLEMPEKYLQFPNARVVYMLKTFTMKHLNLMREDIVREFKAGNRALAVKNATKLITMFTAANMGTDAIKNIMQGKENIPEDLIFDNLLKNTGIVNRYNLGDVFGYSPTEAIVESTIMPPINVFDPPIRTVFNTVEGLYENGEVDIDNIGWEDNVKYIPVLGKIFYMWGLGGIEEWEERQE